MKNLGPCLCSDPECRRCFPGGGYKESEDTDDSIAVGITGLKPDDDDVSELAEDYVEPDEDEDTRSADDADWWEE